MKKIPYGISNFERVAVENYLYVDKTKAIESLEQTGTNVFLIRPRRFGKSLFCEMLKWYYDIKAKDRFKELFGDLYIGKNPTPLANSYLVMSMDFSAIETSRGFEEFYRSFNYKAILQMNSFINHYKDLLKMDLFDYEKLTAEMGLAELFLKIKDLNLKMYLIIDEYDNFANDLLGSGSDNLYKDVMQENGFVRTFYKAIKEGTKTVLDRLFVTGVSPMMLDDLTSGANMLKNYTLNINLCESMGFTEEEVIGLIKELGFDKTFDLEMMVTEMRNYYNGYAFNEYAKNKVYNSDMVLFFLDRINDSGRYPKDLIDMNVQTDYGKLRRIAMIFNSNDTINEVTLTEEVYLEKIVEKVSIQNLFSYDHFISLLFYMGLLTIDNTYTVSSGIKLKIPNYVVRKMYWDAVFSEMIRKNESSSKAMEILRAVDKMAQYGEITEFLDIISGSLKQVSNRSLIKFEEKYIKLLFLFHVSISRLYVPTDEKELDNGYVDVCLERGSDWEHFKYDYIIEMKYIPQKDLKKKDYLSEVKEKGLKQLSGYLQSEYVKNKFKGRNLKAGLLIFKGKGSYEWEEIDIS